MMMTNGFGAVLGSWASGYLLQKYFTLENGDKMWHEIWLSFSGYALVIAILFAIFFKHKHESGAIKNLSH